MSHLPGPSSLESHPFPALALLLACALALAAGFSGRGAAAASAGATRSSPTDLPDLSRAAESAKRSLRERHGEAEGARIDRGVDQVLRLWRPSDGDAAAFQEFVLGAFLPTGKDLDVAFDRFEVALERMGGYFTSMRRDLRKQVDLDLGPITPLDERLAALDPGAHLADDLFESRVAFTALLNFPLSTLKQRLEEGGGWNRRQWAETRLAHQFAARVPADVNQALSIAYSQAAAYVSDYNIYMHHVLAPGGKRIFPEGLRLLNHWNLRDELKARYADPDGLPRQRMIQKVMERIVAQEIPAVVVNNPLVDWDPEKNTVTVSSVHDAEPPPGKKAEASAAREPDERYAEWMKVFHAERLADPYYPAAPTLISRRFDINREIPEAEVKALLESVLASPLGARVASLVQKRLGRPLEPFDIWYAGFKPRGKYEESQLDAMTRKKYPTPEAYAADIPRMLKDLGFSEERARFVADHIEVDPARGSGHAMGAGRRDDKAHLRTRVGKDGMDYKGYNIAVHEMGHNVEQVFSMTAIDHTLLQGVPNTAFTEALAFVFQARDLALLGLSADDPSAERMKALEDFWATREIAGVALVDMGAWRWLYDHPEATPAQFREAVVGIAEDVWNRHYAPLFGRKDVTILGIYAHMVDSGLYLPDYPLGHLIAFQVEQHFKKTRGPMGEEFERITRIGSVTPDAWMRQAVGGPLSAEPLLRAAAEALTGLGG